MGCLPTCSPESAPDLCWVRCGATGQLVNKNSEKLAWLIVSQLTLKSRPTAPKPSMACKLVCKGFNPGLLTNSELLGHHSAWRKVCKVAMAMHIGKKFLSAGLELARGEPRDT